MTADDRPDDMGFEESPGTATIVRPKAAGERKKHRIPRYHVMLWDSDDHTAEYVVMMLRELFGHPEQECIEMALTVHTQGRVIVFTTTKELAELKRDQIIAYGGDKEVRNCKGSMHATIEEE